ncbi:LmbE family N-acetylglucosaminyl deacetylase [Lentzea atacamensis]|uniref:LmbE family N-acetylglucosaminyl deacetylase n=1 Tax=Lentzea atacamensis TaxID=531938 RepID=A0A316HJN9_9PSEU|nr:PIG-L deacetylase family protein [Lentzea atacamensis]PWK80686.1 LmbE family N-acetylglucosaminyl deacetylase [Lentzea atacamensis]
MIPFGLQRGDRVLVVATHPDDETLGTGGTIARLVRSDVEVHVLVITSYLPPGSRRATNSGFREVELKAAAEVLGVAQCGLVWIDDERAQDPGLHLSELVHTIDVSHELSIQALRPHALLMPADRAFHQDHQAVHTACFAAARPGGEHRHTPNIVVGFAGPEDRSWNRDVFGWPVVVDTTEHWSVKEKALACYASQMLDDPHPRSISRVHAIDAAAGTSIGAGTAEMFVPYRMGY